MKTRNVIVLLFFILLSCSSEKITGNYYSSCYFDFYPKYVIKIKNNNFEIYSASVACRKSIGNYQVKDSLLYLYKTHEVVNNFKDTIVAIDTLKYVMKHDGLISIENNKCLLKKTNNKNKLFQLPCFEIDTTRYITN